jgi:hypothetical protein
MICVRVGESAAAVVFDPEAFERRRTAGGES